MYVLRFLCWSLLVSALVMHPFPLLLLLLLLAFCILIYTGIKLVEITVLTEYVDMA